MVDDQQTCSAVCAGYDRWFRVKGNTTCGGPDGICVEQWIVDTDDLDGDGDRRERLRWRHVVVVDCQQLGSMCTELHQLWKCRSPGGTTCYNAEPIAGTEYTVAFPRCSCETATDYPGCGAVNYHYHSYCRCSDLPFYASSDPGKTSPDGKPWVPSGPHGVPFPTRAGESVWVGSLNRYVAANDKQVTVTLTGKSADKYTLAQIAGYIIGGGTVRILNVKDETIQGPPKRRTITFTVRPQPDWEWIRFERKEGEGTDPLSVTIRTHCAHTLAQGKSLQLEGAYFGVPTGAEGNRPSTRIVRLILFPTEGGIDALGAQALLTDPASGTWTWEVCYRDPWGSVHPFGGIAWTTNGPGLAVGSSYSLVASLDVQARQVFELFAIDENGSMYGFFRIVAQRLGVPWRDPSSVRAKSAEG